MTRIAIIAFVLLVVAGACQGQMNKHGVKPLPAPEPEHCIIVNGTPDPSCTPGDWKTLTKHEACTPGLHPRGPISESLRNMILRSYGYKPGEFHGEIDHRVPVFLGGRSDQKNLWPEPGKIPNTKDLEEDKIYRELCWYNKITVRQAVERFTSSSR